MARAGSSFPSSMTQSTSAAAGVRRQARQPMASSNYHSTRSEAWLPSPRGSCFARRSPTGGAPVPFAVDVSSGRTTERKCGHDAIRSRSALTGHGVWSFSGANTYAARFVAMILFDTPPAPPAPGFQTGWLLVRSSFTLVDATRRDITATAQIRAVHPI